MTRTALFVQEACYSHRFIRSRDDSAIVERPERLRSVALGLAAAIARLEEVHHRIGEKVKDTASLATTAASDFGVKPEQTDVQTSVIGIAPEKHLASPQTVAIAGDHLGLVQANSGTDADELSSALDRLSIQSTSSSSSTLLRTDLVQIINSSVRASLLEDEAVKFIHGDIESPGYIHDFVRWASESSEKVAQGKSEIPEGLHQGDLYLCPQSLDAVAGALGTVCQAVDHLFDAVSSIPNKQLHPPSSSTSKHAFVAVRPPGHHCGEDSPSGFCFVNNVMVAAAHAHLKHGVNRVVVFDIDLHHGNGTQAIAWAINEETFRAETEEETAANDKRDPALGKTSPQPPSDGKTTNTNLLKVFYGSLHDVLSYPCEDGKAPLIQAASTSLHGPHGQWIENIHLLPYDSEKEFFGTLYPRYLDLIRKAEAFVKSTCLDEEVLVFISAGFDASLHEYDYMSRHGRKVPTSFYHRFTRDICDFAAKHARGRVVSVLEGGYSQRALSSGAFAHLIALAAPSEAEIDESWWEVDNLVKLEKVLSKPASKGRRISANNENEKNAPWVGRVAELFPMLDVGQVPPKVSNTRNNHSMTAPMERMTLRERKPAAGSTSRAESVPKRRSPSPRKSKPVSEMKNTAATQPENAPTDQKKTPRVILHVKEPETG